ncbi:hypothetical protein R1sor_013758 [Riccia sorocarpa]|uniref:Uncharacterized protein n=1 Tax=Riccia sorocarpa TaxID=122646 RepID=A0ABD3HAC6_9MARC
MWSMAKLGKYFSLWERDKWHSNSGQEYLAMWRDLSPGQGRAAREIGNEGKARDMDLGTALEISRAYEYLQERRFIKSFGEFKSQASDGESVVTQSKMLETASLDASKLSPKKLGLSGNLSIALLDRAMNVNNEIDIRPHLVLVLGLGIADAIYLGDTGVGQVLSIWPPYKWSVLVYEAGHALAGTQFWDETLDNELRQDKLTGPSVNRYSILLFAGIAAEALVYEEAEGGGTAKVTSIPSILYPRVCVFLT